MIGRGTWLVVIVVLVATACRPVTDGVGAPAPAGTSAGSESVESSATTSSILSTKAFDTCRAPTTPQMATWRASSPYEGVGVYIGGRSAACPPGVSNPNFGATWVTTVAGTQGWRLLPLWVGRQAPCFAGSGAKFSTNPSAAALQGIEEAILAANAAASYGIGPASNLAVASPIYYDLEHYGRDPTCISAVRTFVSNWVARLHLLGYRAGFYSSGSSGITDMKDTVLNHYWYYVPDDLWFAHWNNVASAYDSPYVPNSLWVCHRHHQYLGGTNPNGTPRTESYGGVTLNIDSNASHGSAAVIGGQRPTPPVTKCR
jgi:hypothetical protein